MAKHDVTFSVPERSVGNVDIEFKVISDASRFGRLKVSKGDVEWLPGNHKYGYKISWKKLDELMKKYGKRG